MVIITLCPHIVCISCFVLIEKTIITSYKIDFLEGNGEKPGGRN